MRQADTMLPEEYVDRFKAMVERCIPQSKCLAIIIGILHDFFNNNNNNNLMQIGTTFPWIFFYSNKRWPMHGDLPIHQM